MKCSTCGKEKPVEEEMQEPLKQYNWQHLFELVDSKTCQEIKIRVIAAYKAMPVLDVLHVCEECLQPL